MATRKIFGSFVLFCVFCITQVLSQECKSPLGMEDGRIKDSQITVTGFTSTAYGRQARLRRNIPQWGAWCANVSGGKITEEDYDQYIQIDLLKLTKITGIATQGREYNGGIEKVKDYILSYRRDGGVWHFYREKNQTVKVFCGNTNVSTVVQHNLDPTILARYIRVHTGYVLDTDACMRLELYGCVAEKVILSYSMPVGQKTRNGKVHYKDTSYNGVIINDFYKDGTGILTDGKFGPVNAKKFKGVEWVGWNATPIQSQYIDITFEFSGVRKFTNVTLTVNVDKYRDNAVFDRSQIFFSSTKNRFSDTSFLQYCPINFPVQDNPYGNAIVILSLCENTARFMKLRLYFGGEWLLITEISFNSVPASTDEKIKSLQDCLLNTAVFRTTIPSECKNCTTKPETTNSTAMFVGIAVTLAIVIIVLFVILIIYKRRRQASKLSTAVNTVGIENQAAEAETESSPNNQGLDRVRPANGRTAPHEEIQIISPPSVYEMLNRNRPVGRATTNSDRSSGYVIPANGNQIAPYEVAQIVSPPSVNDELNRNQPVGRETTNSDRSSGYVIPDNGNQIAPYKVVQIVSPEEPIRNGPDGRRATAYSDRSSGYEKVQISPLSGYTELDNTKREQKDDASYQKLIKK